MDVIRITLHSDLCAGNGESRGNAVDTDIVLTAAGLPRIPARRLKGCLRAAAGELAALGDEAAAYTAELFGDKVGRQGCLWVGDAALPQEAAFTAWLKQNPAWADHSRVEQLYTDVRGQTRLKDGVADDGSLRFTRVLGQYDPLDKTKALVFEAPVRLENASPEAVRLLEHCCAATRHMGTHRNRGLGNVRLAYIRGAGKPAAPQNPALPDAGMVTLTYHVQLKMPLTLPGCGEQLTAIPARSVIGCLAGAYLRQGTAADAAFRQLFLDGTARWSPLTPVIGGEVSYPAPLALVYLKNDGVYANRCAETPTGKQKTLSGVYTAPGKNGLLAASVPTITTYHHKHRDANSDATLYMQQAVQAGLVYGGTVTLPAALKRVHDNDPKQGGLVPVWYLLADDNGTLRCYLSGASIGRVMQGRSWTEIMGNYAPCADTDALCPGCALFGTVKGKGTSGRVRFTDAEAAQYESLGNKTLPILSGPKPSAYEFYLEKPKSTYETSIGFWNYDFCSLEETKCSPDGTKQTIKKFRVYTPQPRGRKFYWHSAPRTENERSNQNATLEAMKGTFKGSVYFDRITRAQLEELAFVLTLGENTPASPRLHKIGHGKPVGYGSCKITLTGGELRTLAQQDGTLCYTTEPLPLDSLLAAHGRIDTDSTSVKSLLKIADKRSTQSKTVEYPSAKDKNGNDKIFNWFSQNRKHAKSLVTLPHPLDNNITLEPKRGPDPAPRREGFAAPPRRESYTSTPQHEDAPLCVGRVYTGRVTGIKPYGAFVDLGSRRSGLVHIREIANHFVQSVDDELQIGQTVRVRVLDIKQEGGKEKISLSIKQA